MGMGLKILEPKCLAGQRGNSGYLHTCNLGKAGTVGFGCCRSGLGLRKKSESFEKFRELKRERVNTAKSSSEQAPTDLLPALCLEGAALRPGAIAAGTQVCPTSEGERRFLTHRSRRIPRPAAGQKAAR